MFSIKSLWKGPDLTPQAQVVYKDKMLTEPELMKAFAESHGDIYDYQIDPKEEKRMFEELQTVDYLQTYLRALAAVDMQQYFAATTDQQRDIIRGRLARTATLRSKLSDKPDNKVPSKMKGLRYGT